MNEYTGREIKNEYDRRRKEAYDGLQERVEEVYGKVPALEDLDMKAKLLGIRYNRQILEGGVSSGNAASKLEEQLRDISLEKARLLAAAGYPADYLEMRFRCTLCNDTGIIENNGVAEKCPCYKQQVIDHLYRLSNISTIGTDNFKSFDEELFSEEVNQARYGIQVSPRENILHIRAACMNFIENFHSPEEKNLFFTGPTGVGKTFMTGCIASELLNKGNTVLYMSAPALFNIINESRSKSFKDDNYEDSAYRNIFEVSLLIIDDLGTESPSAARYAELLNIINTRQSKNAQKPCKTIISSNVGIKKLYEYYDERIASRIVGNFNIFLFAGDDLRKTLALRRK